MKLHVVNCDRQILMDGQMDEGQSNNLGTRLRTQKVLTKFIVNISSFPVI